MTHWFLFSCCCKCPEAVICCPSAPSATKGTAITIRSPATASLIQLFEKGNTHTVLDCSLPSASSEHPTSQNGFVLVNPKRDLQAGMLPREGTIPCDRVGLRVNSSCISYWSHPDTSKAHEPQQRCAKSILYVICAWGVIFPPHPFHRAATSCSSTQK